MADGPQQSINCKGNSLTPTINYCKGPWKCQQSIIAIIKIIVDNYLVFFQWKTDPNPVQNHRKSSISIEIHRYRLETPGKRWNPMNIGWRTPPKHLKTILSDEVPIINWQLRQLRQLIDNMTRQNQTIIIAIQLWRDVTIIIAIQLSGLPTINYCKGPIIIDCQLL